ncbi:unnamed protein product [Camellia sinensis]
MPLSAIPYPAQGHVLPMLELMQCLAKHGFKVTFNHIHLISIPDGLEPWEDRKELGKLTEAIFQIMPGKLEELIEKINGSDNDKITCIIADQLLGWALEVAEKMQIKRAAFWPAAAALLALKFSIPALLDDGIINDNGIQFQELALGLEIANRPFLWVVRPDITDKNNDAYPEGFKERVATCGRMVGWAPQQKGLGHPSVACFLSHCGWNSTMVGLSNGIPFLCWPYFAYQFLNQNYICYVWKVGLRFNHDESGIIKQEEIKDKVEQLLSNKTIKARALDLKEVATKVLKKMGKLEELIENINGSDNDKIPCIVADELLGWALEVAEKMQIKRAAFWSTATALLALGFRIPELLDDGIIKNNAIPYPAQGHVLPMLELMQCLAKHGFKVTFNHIHLISIPDGLEPWEDRKELGKLTEAIFQIMPGKLEELIEKINGSDNDKITCIIADQLLGWALEVAEKMQIKRAAFWPAAAALLALKFSIPALLDDGIINDNVIQFQELALGLEIANRPFLWVVRPDITDKNNDAYPEGFKERVATCGRMVGWAPQQKGLGHPSVACFLSHCGWNSTMVGLSNGIPFLCWPYFAYQFLNQNYICYVWKVGLRFNHDESGIIKQEEIKDKVEQLLSNKTIKARALDLKEVATKVLKKMGRQHVLAIPYPAQDHVLPLLELMQCLAKHGFKVTFVNTEFTHKRITNALSGKDNIEDHIHLLEELIENINGSDNDKIPCIVADELLGWALEVAEKMQIKRAAFWSTATALLALGFRIPELLDDGIIKNNV